MFKPYKVVFDEKALDYNLGKELYDKFNKSDSEVLLNKGGRVIGKKMKVKLKNLFHQKEL